MDPRPSREGPEPHMVGPHYHAGTYHWPGPPILNKLAADFANDDDTCAQALEIN